ncbi:hypothetical protein LNTAR_10136 [Lentisphaera araneosa HTCC2155]|uniref:Uncharacterized protein n=1 Tax=Lentisphaera araneosa HTCC2155 TaxID=313628 RepID=A6DII0_9BACT|nr:hypothetical protein [Lentisphaera araneosa]EDM28266.1 hypothetical protein LNTAR_10136 [Lentisphaera araneosa HTCC2155]
MDTDKNNKKTTDDTHEMSKADDARITSDSTQCTEITTLCDIDQVSEKSDDQSIAKMLGTWSPGQLIYPTKKSQGRKRKV